jgi:hypothetical protein
MIKMRENDDDGEKLNYHLGLGRWSNETYNYNANWKKTQGIEGYYIGTSRKVSSKIKYKERIIIIEMNLDTNKIVGFGLIRNKFKNGKNRDILMYPKDSGWYDSNEYIYKSNYYYAADEFKNCARGEARDLIATMEKRLFKGAAHYKRGTGITLMDVKKFPNYKQVIILLNSLFNI